MTSDVLAFLGVSLVVIVTPGPDTVLTIRNTLLGGRGAGLSTAAGVVAGQAVWTMTTSLGILALLVASEPLFLAIKYAGAAYLIGIGVQSLRVALRPHRESVAERGTGSARSLAAGAAFRQGLVSNLGNPKMAVFFASLLPQFVPMGGATFWAFQSLALVFCCMTLVWLGAYAILTAKAGEVLLRPRIRRAIDGVTGVVLIGLGLRLAAGQR